MVVGQEQTNVIRSRVWPEGEMNRVIHLFQTDDQAVQFVQYPLVGIHLHLNDFFIQRNGIMIVIISLV